jgi:predicted O-methyltransferase YrrM
LEIEAAKIHTLNFEGDAERLAQEMERLCAGIPKMPAVKRKVLDYQMMALYVLARQYNPTTARMLEIGTGHGGSGYMLARAAPMAQVISLTTNPAEKSEAETFWRSQGCLNITALMTASWDYLEHSSAAVACDLIFVDGDHNQIARDLAWFNRLSVGGLLLCHDYSPEGSRTPSPVVYDELNIMAFALRRTFDVCLVDDGKVGMVGFYRRHGEMV